MAYNAACSILTNKDLKMVKEETESVNGKFLKGKKGRKTVIKMVRGNYLDNQKTKTYALK